MTKLEPGIIGPRRTKRRGPFQLTACVVFRLHRGFFTAGIVGLLTRSSWQSVNIEALPYQPYAGLPVTAFNL